LCDIYTDEINKWQERVHTLLRVTIETAQDDNRNFVGDAGDYSILLTSDLDLLARLIYCEAGNQSYEGMLAVGCVVMNRVKSDKFPDTIHDVIYQNNQFQPVSSGRIDYVEYLPNECILAANESLNGVNVIGDAMYFMNPEISDYINVEWFESELEFIKTIGDHDFYKER
jgi:spore germination cell wall hydrolase CwlJ-like protein